MIDEGRKKINEGTEKEPKDSKENDRGKKETKREEKGEERRTYQEYRALTIFEQKAGFNPGRFEQQIEDWVQTSREGIAGVNVVKQIQTKKVLETRDFKLAQEIVVNRGVCIIVQSINKKRDRNVPPIG